MSRDDDRDYDEPYDDSRDRDRRPRRKKTSHAPLLLILGGVGCLVLLVCGGLIAAAVWYAFKTKLPQATIAATQFLEHLKNNDINTAYSMTSADYRKRNTKKDFEDYVKRFEMFGKHTSQSLVSANVFENGGGTRARITFTLHAPNNAMNCTLLLVQENGAWIVDDLSVP